MTAPRLQGPPHSATLPASPEPALETLPCKVPYASSQAQAARRGPGEEDGFSDGDGTWELLYTPRALPGLQGGEVRELPREAAGPH